MEKDSRLALYIPDNIKTGFEFFPGLGWREVVYGAILTGAAFGAVLIWNSFTEDGFEFFRGAAVVVLGALTSYGLFKKDNFNQSMIDHGRRFLVFAKEQQVFKYRYHDPFSFENLNPGSKGKNKGGTDRP